jgi:hypothetical protein
MWVNDERDGPQAFTPKKTAPNMKVIKGWAEPRADLGVME